MKPDAINELLERLEKYEEAEEERLREEMIAARIAVEVAARMAAQQPQLRRSEMSALAKSQYIRKHGVEAYNRLPLK